MYKIGFMVSSGATLPLHKVGIHYGHFMVLEMHCCLELYKGILTRVEFGCSWLAIFGPPHQTQEIFGRSAGIWLEFGWDYLLPRMAEHNLYNSYNIFMLSRRSYTF